MSGFENYPRELAELDHEIRHYAAVCGVNLANRGEIDAFLHVRHDIPAADQARDTLQGLLILRIKVETEMLEQGITPPSLIPAPPLS